MKKLLPLISLLLIAAFVLSSCAQQQDFVEPEVVDTEVVATEVVATEVVATEVVATEVVDPETIDVEVLVLEKIFGQHTLDFVLSEKRTAEEWDEVLERMIGYGANINEEEKSLIIAWLLEQQQ